MTGTLIRSLMRRSALFGALMKTALVQRLVMAVRRQTTVTPSRGYFLAELLAVKTARRYSLRGNPFTVALRPGTRDTDILQEIFYRDGVYTPPPALRDRLAAAKPLRGLDLGGNIGLFGIFLMGRYPGAQVLSYEPDPANLLLLNANIARNGLATRWRVVEACVSNFSGTVRFLAGRFADSSVVANGDGNPVRCDDVFALTERFDIIKMDIEGSEWDILADSRLGALPADTLVLEWHAAGCPDDDPLGAAVHHLEAAGFAVAHLPRASTTDGMLWAWR